MKFLAAFVFVSSSFAMTCDVGDIPQGLFIGQGAVTLKAIPGSMWNETTKTYGVQRILERDSLIQGMHSDPTTPTIIEVDTTRNVVRVGNIIYVGHNSRMQFGNYKTYSLTNCND